MTYAQPNLFGEDQPDLFAASAPRLKAYRVKPEHVVNRFVEFDSVLRNATVWPWDEHRTADVRFRTWPYLYAKLTEIGCLPEAEHWRTVMDQHAERLDAATPPPTEAD
jgi:hypothetical protein